MPPTLSTAIATIAYEPTSIGVQATVYGANGRLTELDAVGVVLDARNAAVAVGRVRR